MSMPVEYRKEEFVGLRLTRAEKNDLEILMRKLGKNKTDALKSALSFAVQNLPQIRHMRSPLVTRRKVAQVTE